MPHEQVLYADIATLVNDSRHRVAVHVNAEITSLYWQIGKRIKTDILQNKRADYGQQIVPTLSKLLTQTFGKGWSSRQLRYCIQFFDVFSDEQIVHTLCAQLSWSHFKLIIYIEDAVKREFYIEMCKLERWSVRQLEERIGSMLFERTAISRKPEETILRDLALLRNENKLSPDLVFRDPYFLDFLGLKDTFSEKDLESAIIAELQRFILEMGSDFAFLARQKRIQIDHDDYYIDLLFYHRKLKSLVAIDLKMDRFRASYKGQMELYLRWLEKHEAQEGENSPVGLILCAETHSEHVELMRLHESNIKVASYLTALPPFELLQAKLHEAVKLAKEKLESQTENHDH